MLDIYPLGVYNADTTAMKGESGMEEKCCCGHTAMETEDCCRTKARSEEEYKRLVNRLSRIEGQIRGIKGMLDKNAYCPDILAQAAAASAALNAFSRELLSSHIRTCVVEDVRAGREDTVEELLNTMQKFMK